MRRSISWLRVTRGNFKQHRRTTSGNRLLLQNQERRRRILNRTAKAEPRCQRNSPRALHGNVAEIENNHSESITLQQQVGDFKQLPQLRFPAAKTVAVFIDLRYA